MNNREIIQNEILNVSQLEEKQWNELFRMILGNMLDSYSLGGSFVKMKEVSRIGKRIGKEI